MNFFRGPTHLETFAVVAQLHKNKPLFDHDGILMLRDVEGKELPCFTAWKSLHRLLKQVRAATRLTEDFGEIFIDRLNPGTVTNWEMEVAPEYLSFILPLVTNPGVVEYARYETIHAPVGALWWVDNAVHRSSANWGQEQRYHLVIQIRRAAKEEE